MKIINYYYVPDEYKDLEKREKRLLNIDISQYEEILIGDSMEQLAHIEELPFRKRISHNYFTDNDALVSEILWATKLEGEIIRLKTEKTGEEEVNGRLLIKNSLEKMKLRGGAFVFLYYSGTEVRKCAFITEGEMVKLYVNKIDASEIEREIQRFADKTTYSRYELGCFPDDDFS